MPSRACGGCLLLFQPDLGAHTPFLSLACLLLRALSCVLPGLFPCLSPTSHSLWLPSLVLWALPTSLMGSSLTTPALNFCFLTRISCLLNSAQSVPCAWNTPPTHSASTLTVSIDISMGTCPTPFSLP